MMANVSVSWDALNLSIALAHRVEVMENPLQVP